MTFHLQCWGAREATVFYIIRRRQHVSAYIQPGRFGETIANVYTTCGSARHPAKDIRNRVSSNYELGTRAGTSKCVDRVVPARRARFLQNKTCLAFLMSLLSFILEARVSLRRMKTSIERRRIHANRIRFHALLTALLSSLVHLAIRHVSSCFPFLLPLAPQMNV